MVGAGTEARGVIMEAAIKDGTAMHELSSQNICTGVVQSHTLNHRSIQFVHQIYKQVLRIEIGKWECTLSHEETSRWSLWLEKRTLEIPSAGGLMSSRPEVGGGWTAVIAWLVRVVLRAREGRRFEILEEVNSCFLWDFFFKFYLFKKIWI